ncbi:hypothetical protein BZA77DRAFT_15104 [Pyronema omphalodes]|nr:hypothetical protein BZA77DRAFT_15104 [Pyronema omphalodes]
MGVMNLYRRTVEQDVHNFGQTFTSFDRCMQKSVCKIPFIIGCVIAGIIVFTLLWCLIRCIMCGYACCSCCCGGCGGRRHTKEVHNTTYVLPPQPIVDRPPPPVAAMRHDTMPVQRDEPKQYAYFENHNDDALPHMPSADGIDVKQEIKPEVHEMTNMAGRTQSPVPDMGMHNPQPKRPARIPNIEEAVSYSYPANGGYANNYNVAPLPSRQLTPPNGPYSPPQQAAAPVGYGYDGRVASPYGQDHSQYPPPPQQATAPGYAHDGRGSPYGQDSYAPPQQAGAPGYAHDGRNSPYGQDPYAAPQQGHQQQGPLHDFRAQSPGYQQSAYPAPSQQPDYHTQRPDYYGQQDYNAPYPQEPTYHQQGPQNAQYPAQEPAYPQGDTAPQSQYQPYIPPTQQRKPDPWTNV